MISRALLTGLACTPLLGAMAQQLPPGAEPAIEKVRAVVMSDHSTYFVGSAGKLFIVGEVTAWAKRLKGVKGCPVLYSLCSDVPLPIALPFPVKTLVMSGSLIFLLSADGAVTVHGFNDEGKVGLDFSGDVRIAERRFDSVTLAMPEPIEQIAASPRSLFMVGRSGALYRGALDNLRSGPASANPMQRVGGVAPIRTVKSSSGGTVAQDTEGRLWDVGDSSSRALAIPRAASPYQAPGTAPEVLDFALTGQALHVLEKTASRHQVTCYRMLLRRGGGGEGWAPAPCPDGAEKLSLPASGAMRLVPLGDRHVAVRHEPGNRTFIAGGRELRYSMPWLEITDQGVVPRWQIFSHGQRQVLVDDDDIRLVGDNSFTQSGLPDGKTSFTPVKVKGFAWSR